MTSLKATEFQPIGKLFLASLPALLIALSAGCGGHSAPDCSIAVALFVAPTAATADHLAAAPGNKISFVGGQRTA
jgi:hypothetical protein